jgi:hypothetical protein
MKDFKTKLVKVPAEFKSESNFRFTSTYLPPEGASMSFKKADVKSMQ